MQATCTLCSHVFPPVHASKHNQTSNWIVHIKNKHLKKAVTLNSTNQSVTSSSIAESSTTTESPLARFTINTREATNESLRRILTKWIIQCNLPIRCIDLRYFREFLEMVRIPGRINRALIGSEITSYFQTQLSTVRSIISYNRDLGTKFTLCLDCWTSQSQHAFLGISIHFINKDWQMEAFLLDLVDLRRRHTGVYLFRCLIKVLRSFGIN